MLQLTPDTRRGWAMVTVLAITQTAGYGVLAYAFSVYLTPMARDLRTGTPQLTAGMAVAVLVSALAAPYVGRHLDARGGRALMTAGAALGTLAILALSQAGNLPWFYATCVLLGLAMATSLYEPAFAVIVAWFDTAQRAKAILALTVVAGFASSIFMPLTGLLIEAYGWRTALVVLAIGYGALAVPLHALVLRNRTHARPARAAERTAAVRGRPFRLLAASFLIHSGAVAVVSVLLITYLIGLGHPPVFAATVAGLLGVLSVTGRVVTTGLQRRWPVALVTAAVFALQAVAALLLPLIGRSPVGAIAATVLFGLGFGVATIARPALVVERYGTSAYAGISGAMALPITVAKAFAPSLAALAATTAGYPVVMVAVAVACTLSAFALAVYHRL
ncbi:MFS transporter [Nonomuraea soli]|uniref:Putative MFS family arabinose efflux permease n=1 Tax=Nonomuraea soli TaxID=1032476 RepID=A0A7W0CUR6_9ACTN|nr:MFS transporter [Nonomuraea soli]MBA2897630.1 putative MFS family arabinose efflux permease [Nonomuraea soli]